MQVIFIERQSGPCFPVADTECEGKMKKFFNMDLICSIYMLMILISLPEIIKTLAIGLYHRYGSGIGFVDILPFMSLIGIGVYFSVVYFLIFINDYVKIISR